MALTTLIDGVRVRRADRGDGPCADDRLLLALSFRDVLKFADGAAVGTVTLPDGLDGTFVWKGVETPLRAGANAIRAP